jgi:pyridinium-3,5-biscarboxylic acid mononucleotide sulfurtransferase
MDEAVTAKREALGRSLAGFGRVVVAYSGGVDSAYLAAAAHEALGSRSLAVTAVSPSLARRELDQALALAKQRGWHHSVVETHEMRREDYTRNAPDRCYWCKTELFEVLRPIAVRRDAALLVGTNADDLSDYRPGARAAAERSVRTPLADVGLSKADVRVLSRSVGLPTADKPSSPCLASRFAYGVRVTEEGLRRIELSEEVLFDMGFSTLRVRDHGDLARIEVPSQEIRRAVDLRERITSELKSVGWRYVTLDLIGFRSGSMNEVLELPRVRGSGS